MKLDFNLQISQKQGLALTAQVQQAIKLLQMTNTEICQFVDEQFQDNPFIEETSFLEKRKSETNEQNQIKDIDTSLELNPFKNSSERDKVSRENQFETGEAYTPRSTVQKEVSDFDPVNLLVESDKSLYTHCMEYCSNLNLDASESLVAYKLIEELEPTGWISIEVSKFSEEHRLTPKIVENVLQKLQKIEPAGLFARNLKECLTLQAIDRGIYSRDMEAVLDNLHLIGSGKFDLLKRRAGCSDEEIAKIFRSIKSLDPKPGLKFDGAHAPIREPDLRVKNSDNGWILELNNSTLPEVKISKEFAQNAIKHVSEKSEREFIREKIIEAKWLQNAISKRNETMLKVGSEIIKRQTAFLEKGAQYIKPMILNDIAEAVGMHESTISRVTTGSLIQTPIGTLELKAFFSVGIRQDTGVESTSATSIRYRIKKLIEQENANNPLSDDLIVEILSKDGISVARRTVAKYRKIESIPSSFARKRRNIFAGAAR